MNRLLPGITVGIPTYNRSAAVCETVNNFFSDLFTQDLYAGRCIRLIVSDNASDDDTVDELRAIMSTRAEGCRKRSCMQVLESASNGGIQGNLLRLLDACETEYLLVWSDEDDLSVAGVLRAEQALNMHPAAFASPKFAIDGRTYRGRRHGRAIQPFECNEAAFYFSGIIFSIEAFRKYRSAFIAAGCFSNSAMYPPVEVLQGLLALGFCARWLPIEIGKKRVQLPSHIRMSDGSSYAKINGRIEQAKRADKWFTALEALVSDKSGRRVVRRLMQHESRRLLWVVRGALEHEESQLLRATSDHLRTLMRLHPAFLLKGILNRVL